MSQFISVTRAQNGVTYGLNANTIKEVHPTGNPSGSQTMLVSYGDDSGFDTYKADLPDNATTMVVTDSFSSVLTKLGAT